MYIKEANLFNGLSQDFLNRLAKIMEEKTFREGKFIFREGETPQYFYVLEDGKVRLYIGEIGHIVYMVDEQGSAFGWSSLVGRGCYTASAECVTDCTVISIDKDELSNIFSTHLSDGVLFYKRLADNVGERLLNSYKTILSAQRMGMEPSYG